MAGYISSDDEEFILITAACLALEAGVVERATFIQYAIMALVKFYQMVRLFRR